MKMHLDFEAPVAEIEKMINKLKAMSSSKNAHLSEQIHKLEENIRSRRNEQCKDISAWQTVQIARHKKRPILRDYIKMIFTDFVELHGDRRIYDDPAMVGGFARLAKQKVMIIGHDRGKTLEDKDRCRFGSPNPDGYRKALRLMKLAEKFNVPVISFIDTGGAFPGKEAEERGQAEAIAYNLVEMSRLSVPIICIVLGEGGSGGALGIGVGDVLLMLSYAIYSVISPEGCASILWRDDAFKEEAAEKLKITASSLFDLGIADEIVEEPMGGAHNAPDDMAMTVKNVLLKHIVRLKKQSPTKLVNKRFEKYSKIGKFNK